ncbi:MFS transporter [Clostridium sp. MB05]|uniref:MFS transporter n=1 Tax=Clostridium sp. MB05 TaxID=3376682 RepID=UPI003982138D
MIYLKNKEYKNIILFYLGRFISIFGTSIYTFAMSLYVLKITGSSLSFSTTLILSILPVIILNPIAGVIADKYDRKKLVVIADLLNGLFLFSIYLISIVKGLSVGVIYLSTFVITSINIIFDISIGASIPNIVSREKIVNINSGSRIIDSTSSILGPIIGGIIFSAFNIKSFILFNSISFIFSAFLEVFIDFKYAKNQEKDIFIDKNKINYIKDIKEGFKYLITQKYIINMLIIFIIFNFFISFSVTIPMPIILNNILELSSKGFGIIQGSIPVGMIVGAFVVKNVISRYKINNIFSIVGILMSINIILLSIPLLFEDNINNTNIYIIYYSIVMIFMGVCISLVDIPFSYNMQTKIDEEYRARSMSLTISIVKIVVPFSYLISGVLLQNIEAYIIIILGGISVLLISIVFYYYTNKKIGTTGN